MKIVEDLKVDGLLFRRMMLIVLPPTRRTIFFRPGRNDPYPLSPLEEIRQFFLNFPPVLLRVNYNSYPPQSHSHHSRLDTFGRLRQDSFLESKGYYLAFLDTCQEVGPATTLYLPPLPNVHSESPSPGYTCMQDVQAETAEELARKAVSRLFTSVFNDAMNDARGRYYCKDMPLSSLQTWAELSKNPRWQPGPDDLLPLCSYTDFIR